MPLILRDSHLTSRRCVAAPAATPAEHRTISTGVPTGIAFALGLALATLASVAHAQPTPLALIEINYLLRYIGESGCEFKRNGVWNSAAAAEAHVRSKYNYLMLLGRIGTTRDFIDMAATQSNSTGQWYEIRCNDNVPVLSSLWLQKELARYQALRNSTQAPHPLVAMTGGISMRCDAMKRGGGDPLRINPGEPRQSPGAELRQVPCHFL